MFCGGISTHSAPTTDAWQLRIVAEGVYFENEISIIIEQWSIFILLALMSELNILSSYWYTKVEDRMNEILQGEKY